MGTAAIAAQGMTNIIENLNGIMSIGMGIGLMTVVGECLGAGEKEEARRTRECKTLYIHGNMYHDRKTDRVDHGIYSTIWIQGSRRC